MPEALSEADQLVLLNAVPSFQPVWKAWVEYNADYERRFPDAAKSADERAHEFCSELAQHMGRCVADGDLGEAPWLFAALEHLYANADHALTTELTVGFLESLIYSIRYHGGTAAVLNGVPKGPFATRGWRAAYDYIHPSRPEG